jgi:FkbM family methyltransferase
VNASLFSRIIDAVRVRVPRTYDVSGYELHLLPGTRLDVLQRRWPDYDRALGAISRRVFQRYPLAYAVDIGANIGDSAALICGGRPVDVLCIEGMPAFLPILRTNAAIIGPHVRIHAGFVGGDGERIELAHVSQRQGTGSVARAYREGSANGDGVATARSLNSILAEHSGLGPLKLLKSDTDGSDFKILRESMDVIRREQPVLFFEYDTRRSPDGSHISLDCIDRLIESGYQHFLVYDNFGRLLRSDSRRSCFEDLNRYLEGKKTAIEYFDICALHREDMSLVEELIASSCGS